MNLLHGAFAIGAIVGPLAVGLMLQSGVDWTVVYRGIAVIFALLFVLMAFVALPPAQPRAVGQEEAPERLSANPAYWLSFFALFLYLGVELGVSNWVAEYFVAVFAYSPDASAMLVSLFWIGLLAGRFGVPLLYSGAQPDAALVGFRRWRRRPSRCSCCSATPPVRRSPPTSAGDCCSWRDLAARSTTRR